uniref:hypothetical protein n=1 Tax=Stenotrophomonas sp. GbtcB23 TaxID=2824768 RepID=UPI001C30C943
MERDRPDYLPAIRRSRWEFPWLLVLGIVLLGLLAGGAHMLIRTNAAWAARFQTPQERPRTIDPNAARDAHIAEIRLQRVAAEQKAKAAGLAPETPAPSELKCVSGTLFRRIPGGWENVPNRG